MIGLTFAEPVLLVGLLAAAIPWLLHLLASVRAQEVRFPTLRFLKISMEKTARRRRIQHWLLLMLRSAALAFLAIAVAEPISRAATNWTGAQNSAAVIMLDNSYSMAAGRQASRFGRARTEATALLGGDSKPALAALMATNDPPAGGVELTSQLENLRKKLAGESIGYGLAPLSQKLSQALDLLARHSDPHKAVYILSDMQRASFDDLAGSQSLAQSAGVNLFVIDCSQGPCQNVGIADLRIEGRRVADSVLEFSATLVNSSPTDRVVDVVLKIDGLGVVQKVRRDLAAGGKEGSSATVRFRHSFGRSGPVSGQMAIEQQDDLAADNIRYFALQIGSHVQAVVVSPAAQDGGMDPAVTVRLALDPFGGSSSWPVEPRQIEPAQLTRENLNGADAIFICQAPIFTDDQAQTLERFVREGGTAWFFLGPGVDADNYNKVLVEKIPAEGGLLPARLLNPVGNVGPDAPALAVNWVDVAHPYLAGLYQTPADYLTILVQRYFRLADSPRKPAVLMRLANGDPLILAKDFGAGRVVLCATTANPAWSNMPTRGSGLFLPMIARACLQARGLAGADPIYDSGSRIVLRPRLSGDEDEEEFKSAQVSLILPADETGSVKSVKLPLQKTDEGYQAAVQDAGRPGIYQWSLISHGQADRQEGGIFAVNPVGAECRLEQMPHNTFLAAMKGKGLAGVYLGSSLGEAYASAQEQAAGKNWWDLIVVAVIILLVLEAVVANRKKMIQEAMPAHLQTQ
ncbi:MAG: BatA domain-containing protein [Planctomycetes bacterium]|nr:BatA domain-containing protein [Planctomycetota bacterium]